MKRYFLLSTLLFISIFSFSQEIKKMRVEELVKYINESDHPLIVNFWATFCVPCIAEIPYMESAVDKYSDQHVELLLVSLDRANYYPAKIADFVKAKNYSSTVIWLNESNADYFCPKIDKNWSGGIPSSLFINNNSHYRRFFERQITDRQAEEYIKTLLKN